MAKESFDCIIIGSGPGGYVAAIRAAQLGMSVAVIEQDKIGGRCLNYACIPAKAVLRSADIVSEIREAGEFGITVGEPTVDFSAVSARREEVIGTLVGGVEMLMKKNKVELIHGAAEVTGAKSVSVDGRELEAAKAIILATGSVARPVPARPVARSRAPTLALVLTSNSLKRWTASCQARTKTSRGLSSVASPSRE
jgi:dihydrolipoamide dehydrogenase